MPEQASLEGLKFNIGYDVGAAVKGISELKTALSGLSRYVNSSKSLGSVAETIKTLGNAIQSVKADNLLDLSNFLHALSNAKAPAPAVPKRIQEIVTAVSGVTSESVQKVRELTGALRELAEVNPAGGLKVNISSRTAAARSGPAGPFDRPAQDSGIIWMNGQLLRTQMLARGVQMSAVNMLAPLALGANLLGRGLDKAKGAALGAARAVGAIGTALMKTATSPLTGLVNGFKRAANAASGLLSRIGRIAMYRAIRQALQAITQGFHEGLENLYKYSQAVGTTFAGSMDRLATSALYMKNSLAAMASPIIEAIAPAVDYVVDKIVELMNWINQLFAKLTGKNTYTVAVRQATTWGDATASAGKTAAAGIKAVNDELKRSILGFDEINALTKQNTPSAGTGGGSGSPGTSGGTNYSTMFKELPVDSKISDFVDSLKEAFENGNYQEIGEIIGNKLNEVIEDIDTHKWGVNLGKAINVGIDVAYGFLSTAKFDMFGKKVADGINGVLETVNFEKGGAVLAKTLTTKLDFIGGLLGNLNWEAAGKALHDGVTGFFNELTAWVQSKDWEKIGKDMYKNVKDFVENMKLDEMVSSISSFLGSAVKAVIDGAKGFFTGLGGDIKKWWETEIQDADPLKTTQNFLMKGVGGFLDWVYKNIVDPFATALFGKAQWDLYLSDWILNLWNSIKDNPLLKTVLGALNPNAAFLLDTYSNMGMDIDPDKSEIKVGSNVYGLKKDEKGNWVHTYTIEAKFQTAQENARFWQDIVEKGKADGVIDAKGNIDPSDKFFYNAWKNKPNSTNVNAGVNFNGGNGFGKNVIDGKQTNTDVNATTSFTSLGSRFGDSVIRNKTPETGLSVSGFFSKASSKLIQKIDEGTTPTTELTVTAGLSNTGDFINNVWKGKDNSGKLNMVTALVEPGAFLNAVWNGQNPKTSLSVKGYFGSETTGTIKTIGKGETPTANLSIKGYFGAASTDTIKKIGKGETPTGNLSLTAGLANTGAFAQSMWKGTDFGKKITLSGVLAGNQSGFFSAVWNGTGASKAISIIASLAQNNPAAFQKIWNNNVLSVQAKVDLLRGANKTGLNLSAANGTTWTVAASGGMIDGSGFHRIPQFAGGGSPHGTMFIAGEAGPEVVGHIGGRTEVLNASQLASTMYAAIIAGMAATSYAADQMQNELRESTQEQNRLLREQNEILSEMLAGGLVAEVSTMSIRAAQTRMNRRYGNFSGA